MDHQSAVENHTAERYLLGELSNADRDAYEEHFFSCPACAEEVRSADEFMESARKVVQEEIKVGAYNNHGFHRSVWGKWLNWRSMLQPMPAMACALLVTVSGFSVYQNRVVIPRLGGASKAQVVTTAQLLIPDPILLNESRDSTAPITVPKNKAFVLQFDVVDVGFKSYQAEIRNDSEMPVASLIIPKEETARPVRMVVSAGTLTSGRYFLIIHGVDDGTERAIKGELTRISFQLNVQD